MGFFGMVNCYTLRVNLSVAIVAMVNATWLKELEVLNQDNGTDGPRDVCPVDPVDYNETQAVVKVRLINCLSCMIFFIHHKHGSSKNNKCN